MTAVITTRLPVALGRAQTQGFSQVSPLIADLSVENPFVFDLQSNRGNASLDQIQTLYVDNLDNPYPVHIRFIDLNLTRITIPAGAQAFVPAPLNFDGPRFYVQSDYSGSIPILALSLAFDFSYWFPSGAADGSATYIEKTATISNNSTTSSVITLGGATPRRFILPVAFDGTEIEIFGSYDNSAFYSLFNAAGQKAVYNIAGGAGAYFMEDYDLAGMKYFRFVSNSAETPGRTITVICE